MAKAKNILITGGAGYIGSHVVQKLAQDHQVFIVDNLSTGHERLIDPRANFFKKDIRDTEFVSQLLQDQNIDSIIHFAALTDVAYSVREPLAYYDNNLVGTLSLLRACEGSSVERFVFSSTAAVYADPHGEAVTETHPTDPITPYGKSKLMSEACIADGFKNKKFIVLRYFNVAGSCGNLGQIGNHHTVLVKIMAQAATRKRDHIKIFGTDYPTPDGSGVRDYIHVADLADLHILSLKYLEKPESLSQTLNCGYGHGYSVKQVIRSMEKASGQPIKVEVAPRRAGDLSNVIANSNQIQKLFNWTPKYNNLEEICRSAYEWEKKV